MGLTCPKSGDIDGSKIYEAFEQGRFAEIHKYCMQDVEAIYDIWRKMCLECRVETTYEHLYEMAIAA